MRPVGLSERKLDGHFDYNVDRFIETAMAAAEQIEEAQADVEDAQPLEEIVGDKGYHEGRRLAEQSDPDRLGRRGHPVVRVRAGPGATGLVERARGPGARIWQSPSDTGATRTPPDAPTRRTDRTLLRARL